MNKYEQSTKTGEINYKQIVDIASDGIWVFDSEANTTYVNPQMAKMLGYSASFMIGKNLLDFISVDDVDRTKELIQRRKQGIKEIHNYMFTKSDGQKIRTVVNTAPVFDDSGNFNGAIAVISDITDDEKVEFEINELANEYNIVLDHLMDCFFIIDINEKGEFKYQRVNKGIEKLFCINKEKIINKTPIEAFGIESGQKMLSILSECVLKQKPLIYESETNFDNKHIAWHTSLIPIIKDNKTTRIIGFGGDVSVLKNRETAIQKSKEEANRLLEILASISDAFMAFDNEGRCTFCNYQSTLILSKSQEELLGYTVFEIFNDSIAKQIQVLVDEQKGTNLSHRFEAIFNTSNRFYECSFYRCIEGFSLYFCDITDRKKAKEELKNQKELLETVIENIPDPFAIYDKNGSLVKMNAAGRRLYPEEAYVNASNAAFKAYKYFNLSGDEIQISDLPAIRALRGEMVKNSIVVIKRDGKDQITEVNITPIFDRNNNLVSIASLHRDITETVQNQKLIKDHQDNMLQNEKEKNEALEKAIGMKDEFLSLISHEFKTPITVINSAIQTMEFVCKNELTDKGKGLLNKIRQNTNRQLKLINNLLDITRISSGQMMTNIKNTDIIELTSLITESITPYSEQKGIKLSFSSTISKKVIGIDEDIYQRILLNLLSNAVKFTPCGKSVSVNVSQKNFKQKKMVCIQVDDKGTGIPQDKNELIFERFGQVDQSLTRQAEGTGMGLYLVKLLVELLEGVITLHSKEGDGSTFTILFPIRKANLQFSNEKPREIIDNRITKAIEIEFSDIYY